MNANMGRHHHYPSPACCVYNGITIPGLVFSSKGGGFIPKILVEYLQHLDALGVYPRGNGFPDQALLVDGHGSRVAPLFVQYINNLKADLTPDPFTNHHWRCAFWAYLMQQKFGKLKIRHKRMEHSSIIAAGSRR